MPGASPRAAVWVQSGSCHVERKLMLGAGHYHVYRILELPALYCCTNSERLVRDAERHAVLVGMQLSVSVSVQSAFIAHCSYMAAGKDFLYKTSAA